MNTRKPTQFCRSLRIVLISAFLGLIAAGGPAGVSAQSDPLTLAEVLTALQSKSSGMSLSQKNAFITTRVRQRGVTFRLTPELRTELRRAGASTVLINAIGSNGPEPVFTPTPVIAKPDVKFDRTWIEFDVTSNSQKGLRVHSKFTIYNLKDESLYMSLRFIQNDGTFIRTSNKDFSNKRGEVAVYRTLKPAYAAAVFRDLSVFIPYKELHLPIGRYDLKADVDIIYKNGDIVKHLTNHAFEYDNTRPATAVRRVKFDRLWVDYNIRRDGALGMVIHTKMTVYNMKDESAYLAIYFEKQSGEKLTTSNTKYRSQNGQVAVFKSLRPAYVSTIYRDLEVFIPYAEFKLGKGVHNLKLDADLIEPAGKLISHIKFHNFRYTKR